MYTGAVHGDQLNRGDGADEHPIKEHVPGCEESVAWGLGGVPVLPAAYVGAGCNIVVGGLERVYAGLIIGEGVPT